MPSLPLAPCLIPMDLTPDQLLWLASNKDAYETILMHAILHDKMRRSSMLGVPLVARDFSSTSLAAILQGLILAESVMAKMDASMPFPPTVQQLQTYMLAATKEKDSLVIEEELPEAHKVLEMLQDPRRSDQWYFLDTYFATWLSSVRVKGYARKAQMNPIANASEVQRAIEKDIRAANAAIYSVESDERYQALYGTATEGKVRRSTGFAELDEALGGGLGEAECVGVMSGTGGGKSVLVGQMGYHEALTGGWPLILTTELSVIQYITRMISNACNIKISLIKDCLNVGQIKQLVASTDPAALGRVEVALRIISERIGLVKLHPDQGLGARAIMEQQIQLYEHQFGHKPTLVIFDWLGRVADVAGTGKQSDRTVAWEIAADSCVQFAEISGIPTVVLLQAVNNANTKSVLTIEDTGISKGVWKQMVAGIGITNKLDTTAVKAALLLGGGLPGSMRTTLDDQLFCLLKSRHGEGTFIPVKRQFLYQRFQSGKRS